MNFSSLIKEINTSFARPYPLLCAEKYCWVYISVVSAIIALLINIEQPFGLQAWTHPDKWLILSGFGGTYVVVNVILYMVFPRVFPAFFHAGSWTVGKEIFILSILFLIAGFINWIHALSTISYFNLSWYSFFHMQFYTLTFGILPVFTLTSFVQIKNLLNARKPDNGTDETGNALEMQQPVAQTIHINCIPFVAKDILYLQANQNYMGIHFDKNGKKEKQVFRTTIKQLELQLAPFPQFVRCHKSYLVNTEMILKCKGNSGKMEIQLNNCPEKIPVSRNYVSCIKAILKVG